MLKHEIKHDAMLANLPYNEARDYTEREITEQQAEAYHKILTPKYVLGTIMDSGASDFNLGELFYFGEIISTLLDRNLARDIEHQHLNKLRDLFESKVESMARDMAIEQLDRMDGE
jgi:hypothetical protein